VDSMGSLGSPPAPLIGRGVNRLFGSYWLLAKSIKTKIEYAKTPGCGEPGENRLGCRLASCRYGRVNADFFAALAASFESYYAISQSIEGVIFANAYVVTSMYRRAALTNDDIASSDYLAAIAFHAQALSI
jgi:hypothetical protein